MSRRLEIIRRLNKAFNARESDWTRFYAEDVEFHMPPDWLDDRVLQGRTGVERGAGMWRENVDGYGWDEERLIEAPECVVGLFHHRGRIHGTDQRIEAQIGAVFYFDGELISKVVAFGTWEPALEAAGIAADIAR